LKGKGKRESREGGAVMAAAAAASLSIAECR